MAGLAWKKTPKNSPLKSTSVFKRPCLKWDGSLIVHYKAEAVEIRPPAWHHSSPNFGWHNYTVLWIGRLSCLAVLDIMEVSNCCFAHWTLNWDREQLSLPRPLRKGPHGLMECIFIHKYTAAVKSLLVLQDNLSCDPITTSFSILS